MTEYKIDTRGHRLTVAGHAGSAVKGEDIVCAAVSAIVRLMECGIKRAEKSGWLWYSEMHIVDGYANMACSVLPEHESDITFLFENCEAALDLIREAAPEYLCRDREEAVNHV